MLYARYSSPANLITSLPISHKSEDIWFLPFNTFSVSKTRFKKDSTLLQTDLMDTSTLNVKLKRNVIVGVVCYCTVSLNVIAYLRLQRLFAAGKAEDVISAVCPEVTCSISLNHLMTAQPIDLHHSFTNNVCYLQAWGKLLSSYYSPFSCCCHHNTW